MRGLNIQRDISLKPYTVFKIGGNARFFVEVKSREELIEALKFATNEKLNIFVAGAGSNILVSDKGFAGLYIKNSSGGLIIDNEKILADSGVMMPYLSSASAKAGLSGLEWGIGIPGTVGGSVRGNAGCYGKEIKDIVSEVDVFDRVSGEELKMKNGECNFGYRNSIFKTKPNLIVLAATFSLSKGNSENILFNMRELSARRVGAQDIGAKCAGCIFKNVPWVRKDIKKDVLISRFPELKQFEAAPGISSGFLVDESGLKGKRIGGAMISRKHANFVINEREATSEDVVMLIAVAKEYVHRKFGILLEEEIQYLP